MSSPKAAIEMVGDTASHGFDTLKHHVKSAATAVRVAVHSHAVPADADASVAAPPPVSKSFVNFVGGQAAKIDHLLKEKLKVKRMHCDVQLDVVVGSQVGVAAAQIGVSVTMLQMSWDDSRYEDNPTLPGHLRLFYMQCTLSALAFLSCVLIYLNYHLCSFNRSPSIGGHSKYCSCGWRVDRPGHMFVEFVIAACTSHPVKLLHPLWALLTITSSTFNLLKLLRFMPASRVFRRYQIRAGMVPAHDTWTGIKALLRNHPWHIISILLALMVPMLSFEFVALERWAMPREGNEAAAPKTMVDGLWNVVYLVAIGEPLQPSAMPEHMGQTLAIVAAFTATILTTMLFTALMQTISEDANLEASLQAEALALLQEDKAVAAADIVGAWYRFHRARIARDDKDEDQDPRSKLEDLLKERPSVVHARFASPPFGLVLEAGYAADTSVYFACRPELANPGNGTALRKLCEGDTLAKVGTKDVSKMGLTKLREFLDKMTHTHGSHGETPVTLTFHRFQDQGTCSGWVRVPPVMQRAHGPVDLFMKRATSFRNKKKKKKSNGNPDDNPGDTGEHAWIRVIGTDMIVNTQGGHTKGAGRAMILDLQKATNVRIWKSTRQAMAAVDGDAGAGAGGSSHAGGGGGATPASLGAEERVYMVSVEFTHTAPFTFATDVEAYQHLWVRDMQKAAQSGRDVEEKGAAASGSMGGSTKGFTVEHGPPPSLGVQNGEGKQEQTEDEQTHDGGFRGTSATEDVVSTAELMKRVHLKRKRFQVVCQHLKDAQPDTADMPVPQLLMVVLGDVRALDERLKLFKTDTFTKLKDLKSRTEEEEERLQHDITVNVEATEHMGHSLVELIGHVDHRQGELVESTVSASENRLAALLETMQDQVKQQAGIVKTMAQDNRERRSDIDSIRGQLQVHVAQSEKWQDDLVGVLENILAKVDRIDRVGGGRGKPVVSEPQRTRFTKVKQHDNAVKVDHYDPVTGRPISKEELTKLARGAATSGSNKAGGAAAAPKESSKTATTSSSAPIKAGPSLSSASQKKVDELVARRQHVGGGPRSASRSSSNSGGGGDRGGGGGDSGDGGGRGGRGGSGATRSTNGNSTRSSASANAVTSRTTDPGDGDEQPPPLPPKAKTLNKPGSSNDSKALTSVDPVVSSKPRDKEEGGNESKLAASTFFASSPASSSSSSTSATSASATSSSSALQRKSSVSDMVQSIESIKSKTPPPSKASKTSKTAEAKSPTAVNDTPVKVGAKLEAADSGTKPGRSPAAKRFGNAARSAVVASRFKAKTVSRTRVPSWQPGAGGAGGGSTKAAVNLSSPAPATATTTSTAGARAGSPARSPARGKRRSITPRGIQGIGGGGGGGGAGGGSKPTVTTKKPDTVPDTVPEEDSDDYL